MRKALIFGGGGALGQAVLSTLVKANWSTISVDLAPVDTKLAALGNVVLKQNYSIQEMQEAVLAGAGNHTFDAVINVAGGWAGGNVSEAVTAANSELMLRQSVFTSIAAAHVAATKGNKNSLLVLTGSAASLKPTSFMVGYGMAKAAVHHIVRSAAADASVLPPGQCILGICPVTLDTPGNRSGMPDADFTSWTPLPYVSEEILQWANSADARPASGSLVVFNTKAGKTTNSLHTQDI